MTAKRWMRGGVVMAVLAMAAACSESTGPEEQRFDALVTAPMEMTLRAGGEKSVGGSVLRLSFGRVLEDSRCPIDAICVWQGNAAVELGIRAGMGPTVPLRVNTTLEPRSVVWNGIRVTLLEVAPAPKASEPIRPEAYSVKVRVEGDAK